MANRQLYLTRQYRFSAAHYLNSPHLNREENISTYGKCGNHGGHGHNYILKITLKGIPDTKSGSIVGLTEMDSIVKDKVLKKLDHENLNLIHNKIGIITSENLIKEIWSWIEPYLKPPLLYKIEIYETSKNSFQYTGSK